MLTPFVVFSLRSSLYEFFFLLDPCLRMNRPVLSNTGVVLVSKRVVPHFPPPSLVPRAVPPCKEKARNWTSRVGLGASWKSVSGNLTCPEPALHLSMLSSRLCFWKVVLPHGQQPRATSGDLDPECPRIEAASMRMGLRRCCDSESTSACVALLNRHLDCSCICITDLFTNQK